MPLVKPTIGQTSWGGTLNTALDYLDGNTTTLSSTVTSLSSTVSTLSSTKAPLASPTFTGTVSGITKSMVGLSNVDNTSDANKPISTATQTALDLKANSSSLYSYLPITTKNSGEYYSQYPVSGTVSSGTAVTTQRLYTPVWIPAACTILSLGVRVSTGAASTGLKLALYSNVNNKPSVLLQDFGTINTTASNTTVSTTGTSYSITTPGFYWVAYELSTSTNTAQMASLPNSWLQPLPANTSGSGSVSWRETITNADPFPSTVTNTLTLWSSAFMVFVGV